MEPGIITPEDYIEKHSYQECGHGHIVAYCDAMQAIKMLREELQGPKNAEIAELEHEISVLEHEQNTWSYHLYTFYGRDKSLEECKKKLEKLKREQSNGLTNTQDEPGVDADAED